MPIATSPPGRLLYLEIVVKLLDVTSPGGEKDEVVSVISCHLLKPCIVPHIGSGDVVLGAPDLLALQTESSRTFSLVRIVLEP